MRRLIFITLFLLCATVIITVAYFKTLKLGGHRTEQAITSIPPDAAIVFELHNDDSFYEIYRGSRLWTALLGEQKLHELQILQNKVLQSAAAKQLLNSKAIFISLHKQNNNAFDFLINAPLSNKASDTEFNQMLKGNMPGVSAKPINIGSHAVYELSADSLDRPFYVSRKNGTLLVGSFSKELIEASLNYHEQNNKPIFALLPDQQGNTSLANMYVSYAQLHDLLGTFYRNNNIDLLKPLQLLPATAALSLNYKSDALRFNGFTSIKNSATSGYLSLFRDMKPVEGHLDEIFPSTTAYSYCFAVDNVQNFEKLLADWDKALGYTSDRNRLFKQIKAETGVQFDDEFNSVLSNEFAIVTTRFDEKLAIIKLTNGDKLRPFISNISTMVDERVGQLNYSQVPLFLLGDAFANFQRPYFLIADNYLLLANTPRELTNYYSNYLNNEFISKQEDYIDFNNLLAQQYNFSFFINFKNAGGVFKRSLKRDYYRAYQQQPGFKDFYGASYQLSATEHQFFSSLCIKLKQADTVSLFR